MWGIWWTFQRSYAAAWIRTSHWLTHGIQIDLKLRYKFRLILDETWSFGVLGRTGRGITEYQNVDAAEVDMIIGSLAGPLCAGGGFCAGSDEIVEHQRISASAYTFSAALPAMLATTASEVLSMIQTTPEMLGPVRENIKTMWAQLDPRSDWVHCTSSVENPIMILPFKPEVVANRKLSASDQEQLLQEAVDEASQSPCWNTSHHSLNTDWFARRLQTACLSRGSRACLERSMQPAKRSDGSFSRH